MDIKEIIKSDSDRLFIVDYESFVIYTGENPDDDKPFIRIGSWPDMPVELIPLTENIIITDEFTGNPAYEQFNIDLRLLRSNRYIGSKNAVSRFLNYQKIFNLDLKNASIVEIERDIPELSKEKNISEKNQFIGVFYSDGNFKTVHGGKTIFDLNLLKDKTVYISEVHDKISEKTGKKTGTGFAIIDRNPVFFFNDRAVTYLFPLHYYTSFLDYGIDPASITDIIYPSLNMINLAGFLKWKNATNGRVTVYSDYTDRILLTKKLFSDCDIRSKGFTGMRLSLGNELTISSYSGSYNLFVEFASDDESNPIVSAFIKGKTGVESIIKEKPDLLIISYSAYEDLIMILKSAPCPIVIIDDGNKNISKVSGMNPPVLTEGMYSLRRMGSIEEIYESAGMTYEDFKSLSESPEDLLRDILSSGENNKDTLTTLINSAAVLSALMDNTPDRKKFSTYKTALDKFSRMISGARIKDSGIKIKSILAIFDGRVYRFAERLEEKPPLCPDKISGSADAVFSDKKVTSFHNKVISDRLRLAALLDLLKNENGFIQKQDDLTSLQETIADRKNLFLNSVNSIDSQNSNNIFEILNPAASGSASGSDGTLSPENISSQNTVSLIQKTMRLAGENRIITILILLLLLASVLFSLQKIFIENPAAETGSGSDAMNNSSRKNADIGNSPGNDKEKELTAASGQTAVTGAAETGYASETDIYYYANRIAELNGYSRIPMTDMRKKNPNWIYPGNVFRLHDNESKTVIKGDTLWEISRKKIISTSAVFNKLIIVIKSEHNPDRRRELIKQAKNTAATQSQLRTINEIEKSMTE